RPSGAARGGAGGAQGGEPRRVRPGRRLAVPKYDILVDGERQSRASSADEVRSWLLSYRAEHAADDPDAAHVQVRELTRLAWLTGGRLLDRDQFLDLADSGG